MTDDDATLRSEIPGNASRRERAVITRRRALALGGAAGLAAVVAACGGGSSSSGASGASASGSRHAGTRVPDGGSSATGASGSSAAASCVLTPEVTEGPYYLDADLVRSDVTEGKPGTPLELAITVLDATSCTPVRDAAVDIWHCDAGGVYSGFQAASTGGPGPGGGPPARAPGGSGGSGRAQDSTRYLRGTQVTGDDGVVTFHTIYPGWYRGRAVHIHMKVHAGTTDQTATRHTGQLFFDEDLTTTVYGASPYREHGQPDTPNADDSIYADAGAASAIVPVTPSGSGYRGTMTVGIRTSQV
jgi:protocatechuate 3,4-dioxygenase beta subunit